MIDISGADSYFTFGRHPAADLWRNYSTGARKGAIEMAKRVLSRGLKRPLEEELPPYQYGDERRDDFAAYEQALFELSKATQPDGMREANPIVADAINPARSAQETVEAEGPYAVEALRWLGWGGHVTLEG